jgi:hypothetical protein
MVHGRLWPGAILLTNQLDPHVDPQAVAGEAVHIAPEVRTGAPAVFASDVFGLGRLLWFVATDGAEIEPSSARLAPQTAGIATVVRRACAVDPDSRHASVADLLAHLEAALVNEAPQSDARPRTPDARPSSRRRVQPKPPARRVAPIALGVAALFALVLALVAGSTKSAPILSAEIAAAVAAVFGGMALLLRRQRPTVGA